MKNFFRVSKKKYCTWLPFIYFFLSVGKGRLEVRRNGT